MTESVRQAKMKLCPGCLIILTFKQIIFALQQSGICAVEPVEK